MDNIFIVYQIKVSIALAMFYVLYMLCFRGDTFLKIRRFFFLFSILFSVLFPFVKLKLTSSTEAVIQIPGYWLSDFEFNAVAVEPMAENSIGIWDMVLIFFALVSVLLALRFVAQLFSIFRLKTESTTEDLHVCHIVKINDEKASPFSFFRWIFINENKYDQNELGEIITHEQVHVKQFHSIDVILFEVLCICFWWNPFVWLLKKEMKINLEYLADAGVLNAGFDSKEYQYILLQVSNKSTGIPLINNFNVSQLKKRITMMNKRKTSIAKAVKYLLAVPIGSLLLLGNAVQASSTDLLNPFMEEPVPEIQQKRTQKDGVFNTVEQMPKYTGGEKAMLEFIQKNLKYPESAEKNNIEGRVIIRFIVGADGAVSDVELIRGISPEADAEAVRVIKAMPNWIPGKQKGKAVPVYFTLPIVYSLKKETSNSKPVGIASLKESESYDASKPFMTVEQMPSFQGGESAMQEFIANNLKYPVKAFEEGVQGRVTIRFIVGADGSINDVKVIRGISPEADAEAARVIKAMPNWVPGKQNGIEVPVYFTLPIVYRLKKDEPKENTPQT